MHNIRSNGYLFAMGGVAVLFSQLGGLMRQQGLRVRVVTLAAMAACTWGLVACGGGSDQASTSADEANPQAAALGATSEVQAAAAVSSPAFANFSDVNMIDTVGTLPGMVQFAQHQVIPARERIAGDEQPHLTGARKTLVMLKVAPQYVSRSKVLVRGFSSAGAKLGQINLLAPAGIPKTPRFVPGVDPTMVLPTSLTKPFVVPGADLAQLTNTDGTYLSAQLQRNPNVQIEMWNGQWVPDTYLPAQAVSGALVLVTSQASYPTAVRYLSPTGAETLERLNYGETKVFKRIGNYWVGQADIDHNAYVYGADYWTAQLPANWVQPGLRLEFVSGTRVGRVNSIEVGAPSELLMHTIDIGMLTPPRNQFDFASDTTGKAQQEYFETVPLSRLTVSRYAPLHLTEVVMPTGARLTTADPSVGSWHEGDMREDITKNLIAQGINSANYGVHSSSGNRGAPMPFYGAQLMVHNSRGAYSNGVIVHGGSGGAGIVTLDRSLGNEFSHEVGHNFNLSHYYGGAVRSIHSPANALNSAWGWDSRSNVFLPNFYNIKTNSPSCLPEADGSNFCQNPFRGFEFGRDSMAGGFPLWPEFNRFTMYTPHSSKQIQSDLESKVVLTSSSSTGFKRWNATTKKMEEYLNRVNFMEIVNAEPSRLATFNALGQWQTDAQYISDLFDKGVDRIQIAMANGYWVGEVAIPAANATNLGKALVIDHQAGYPTSYSLNGATLMVHYGDKRQFISDGSSWVEKSALPESTHVATPILKGVPVTTIVGYYDPEARLSSYIYPSMHGSYGFVYPSDPSSNTAVGCRLQVGDGGVTRNFRLSAVRQDPNLMNKFHVNVPRLTSATSARVYCNGSLMASRLLTEPGSTSNQVTTVVTSN